MTKRFANYRYWQYITEDDYATTDHKSDAIEAFERFWERTINPEEVKEVFMYEFSKKKDG